MTGFGHLTETNSVSPALNATWVTTTQQRSPGIRCAVRKGREEEERLPTLWLYAHPQPVKVSHSSLVNIIQVHQQRSLPLEAILPHKIGWESIL